MNASLDSPRRPPMRAAIAAGIAPSGAIDAPGVYIIET
jgi:hypothetical protein